MKVVRVDTRPVRLALAVSTDATGRVIRRAFRLLGGRWGGSNDLLLCIDASEGLTQFDLALLGAADPDYVMSIDPQLDELDWEKWFRIADIQPFEFVRLRERMETRFPWSRHFVEEPILREQEERSIAIVDHDRPGLTWKMAAVAGLPLPNSQATKVPPSDPPQGQTPVVMGRAHLTAFGAGPHWLLFGKENSLRIAADYWSLRALGARPNWLDEGSLDAQVPPASDPHLVIHAPHASTNRVQKALTQWAPHIPLLHWSRQEPSANIPTGGAYFASNSQAVPDDGPIIHFSTPPLPVMDGRIRPGLTGTVEVTIESTDPSSPDGIALTRNNASRLLIDHDHHFSVRDRVTRTGLAGIQAIDKSELLEIPRISYRDAVSAPFIEAGYYLSPSDKGRYQQRSLQLARGLRYLSACFKRPESARLLDLFFEHHLGHDRNDLYRRAITYEDLHNRLMDLLRERRRRLPRKLVERAEAWLLGWTNGLLERGLMIGGYVLSCSHCAHRAWYRLDDLTQAHTCERCAAETHLPANATRSFHLNEAFYQLRLNNGEVVTLLLAALREIADHSLLYLPEISLSHEEAKDGEADVAALVDGDLVIAEAKSNNSISKKEAAWYQYVAERTRARRLVFATTDRSNPLCANLECMRCKAENGPHFRDYAWSEGSRQHIGALREKSVGEANVDVHTLCFQSLVHGPGEDDYELENLG